MAIKFIDSVNMNNALYVNGVNRRVGIGLENPQSKLHIETGSGGTYTPNTNHDDVTIEGSGNIGLQLFSPNDSFQYIAFGDPDSVNAGYLRYHHGDNKMVLRTNGSDNMAIDSAGNVGIGVTGPTSKLTIQTDAGEGTIELLAVNAATTQNKIIFSEAVLGDESFFIEHDGAGAGADNLLKIHGDGSGATASGVTIRRNGLVGIGTDSPDNRLDVVASDVNITPNTDSSAVFRRNGNNYLSILSNASNEGGILFGNAGDANDGSVSYAHNTQSMAFTTADTEKMSIASDGTVVIGSSSVGGNKTLRLLSADNAVNYDIDFQQNGTTNHGRIRYTEGASDLQFFPITGQTANLTLAFNGDSYFQRGNVGIGTTNPSSKLTVSGPTSADLTGTNNSIRIENHTSTNASPGQLGNGIVFAQPWWSASASLRVTGGIFGVKNGGDGSFGGGLAFYTQPNSSADMAQHMVIRSNGDLGIGTDSPNPYSWGNKHVSIEGSGTNQYVALDLVGTGSGGGFVNFGGGDGSGTAANILRGNLGFNDGSDFVINTNNLNSGTSVTERLRISNAGAIKFNAYDSTNNTGTPTYLLGTDASGNVVKTLDAPATANVAPMVKFSRTGINSSTYTMLATINGDRLASVIKMTMTGTSSNVVFACDFDIIVNHFKDIHVKSFNGDYTEITLRITSNNNEDFSIEAKHNGSTTTEAEVCIFPLATEIVTPTTTDPGYTGQEYEHTATEGWRFGGTDSNIGSGNVIVDERIIIGKANSSGNVGLQVKSSGDSSLNDGIEIERSTDNTRGYLNANSGSINLVSYNNSAPIKFRVGTSGQTTAQTILSNGNIGIGEDNPTAQLHIADSSNNSSGIRFTTVNGGNNDAVNMHFQGSQPFAPFYISRKQTGGAEIQLQFDGDIILNGTNGDNTGIGTTQPQQKLHVNGNILCGSSLYFDTGTSNSITGSGGALNFQTNSSDVMQLKFGGDVDIFNSLNVTDKVSVGGILQVKDQIDLYQDGNASTIRGGIAIGNYGNFSFVTNFTNDVGFSFNNRIFLSSINQSSIQADLTGGFNSTEVCNFVMTDLTGTGNNYANLELKQMSVSSSGSSRTTNTAIKFANGSNAIKGTITFGNGGVSYNTTSDYRLKEDFKDFNGLDLVSEINVYDFKWKEGGRSYGVKAHELQEINEDWATGEKDEIGEIKSEDGTHVEGIIPQQVDYSALVPVLIKSIQELEAKVKDLESRI